MMFVKGIKLEIFLTCRLKNELLKVSNDTVFCNNLAPEIIVYINQALLCSCLIYFYFF